MKLKKGEFLGMLLETIGASLWGNIMVGTGVISNIGSSLLGNMLAGTVVLKVGTEQLKQMIIIDAISEFN